MNVNLPTDWPTVDEVAARRERWIEALWRRRYEQAAGLLRRHSCFCVMGVAEDIYGQERGGRWVRGLHGVYRVRSDGGALLASSPTQEALHWYGLRGTWIWVPTLRDWRGLSALNDDRWTFPQLAALISQQPPSWEGTRRLAADQGHHDDAVAN